MSNLVIYVDPVHRVMTPDLSAHFTSVLRDHLAHVYTPTHNYIYRHARPAFVQLIDALIRRFYEQHADHRLCPEPTFLPWPLEPRRWPADRVMEVAFSRLTGGETQAILCPPPNSPDHFTRRYNRWARNHLRLLDLGRNFMPAARSRPVSPHLVRSAYDRRLAYELMAHVRAFLVQRRTGVYQSRFTNAPPPPAARTFVGSLQLYLATHGSSSANVTWRRFSGTAELNLTRAGYVSRSQSYAANHAFLWPILALRSLPPSLGQEFSSYTSQELLAAILIRNIVALYRLAQACISRIEEHGDWTQDGYHSVTQLVDVTSNWLGRLQDTGYSAGSGMPGLRPEHIVNFAALEPLLARAYEYVSAGNLSFDPWSSDHELYHYQGVAEDGCWYPEFDQDEDEADDEYQDEEE